MKIARVISEKTQHTVVEKGIDFFDFADMYGTKLTDDNYFDVIMNKDFTDIKQQTDTLRRVAPDSFLLPIPKIGQIRDFYAFEEHVRTARKLRGLDMAEEWYEFPAYYYSGNSSVFPGDANVNYPSFTNELDYELEIAAVIGKDGKDIKADDAWNHILGFTLACDWSARDQQRKEMKIGLGPSKSKDFATSFGKTITTSDEVLRHTDRNFRIDCTVAATVNDKLYTRTNIINMHWTFPQLIEWASKEVELKAGDIIMSGTVPGGCILELGSDKYGWLSKGNKIKFKSEYLGELESEIV